MIIFILLSRGEKIPDYNLENIRKYVDYIENHYRLRVKFTDVIDLDTYPNSYYFRFEPSFTERWLENSNRIVGIFNWNSQWSVDEFNLAARCDSYGGGALFEFRNFIGLKKVALEGGFRHSKMASWLPFTNINDKRFNNKCDALLAYLDVYHKMLIENVL